jgi:hypothetical protein
MSTISTTISHSIVLAGSGAYASPLDIAASGGVVISSGPAAIYGPTSPGSWRIVNHGTVSSPNFGIDFETGSISNFGFIGGNEGIVIVSSPGVVRNRGTIFGLEQAVFLNLYDSLTNHGEISSDGIGIVLYHGGSIDNTGVILGSYAPVGYADAILAKDGGTVVNSGTIGAHIGIRMNAGGGVLNRGLIEGGIGIEVLGGDATIANGGTIAAAGSAGEAVSFAGGGTDRLIVDPGAVFAGNVTGDGSGSTLELARGKPGSLSGIGTSFQSFGVIEVDPKATWHLSGDASGSNLVNDGKIVVDTKQAMVFGTIGEDKGKHGTIGLVGSAAAEFKEAVDKGEKLAFAGTGGTLTLDAAGSFQATISGFKKGDTIELADTAADKVGFSKEKLAITDGGMRVATLSLKGHYTTKEFVVTAEASNTLITIGPPKASASPVFVCAEWGGRGGDLDAREGSAGGGRMESFRPFGGGAVPAAGAGGDGTLLPWAADPFHFWTVQG